MKDNFKPEFYALSKNQQNLVLASLKTFNMIMIMLNLSPEQQETMGIRMELTHPENLRGYRDYLRQYINDADPNEVMSAVTMAALNAQANMPGQSW